MKKFLMLLTATAVGFSAYAQNNVLAQLGARGVTVTGGTSAYSNYMVRLDAQGRLATSLMPRSLSTMPAFSKLVYIDPVVGTDTVAATGSAAAPYSTFDYAAQRHGSVSNIVYVFAPGVYGTSTVNPVAYPGLRKCVIMGYGADVTSIYKIKFDPGIDLDVTFSGVRLNYVQQSLNKPVKLTLLNGTVIGELSVPPTSCVIARDPGASVSAVVGGASVSNVFLHQSQAVQYAGTNTAHWGGAWPVQVSDALHRLAWRPYPAYGISPGDMCAWSGSNWIAVAAGTSNQYFRGGASPGFAHLYVVPGTGVGQVAYWNGNDWTGNVATADTEAVMFGGDVPYFARLWADRVRFEYAGKPYANVSNALNDLLARLSGVEAVTGAWSWAVGDWSNSVARTITAADTGAWSWAVGDWSNSVARTITAADTGAWTQAAMSPGAQLTAVDTQRWYQVYNEWNASLARTLSGGDTNKWWLGYVYGTNWVTSADGIAQALQGWSNSPAFFITGPATQRWDQAYDMGTNWSQSPAAGIAAADTGRWNEAAANVGANWSTARSRLWDKYDSNTVFDINNGARLYYYQDTTNPVAATDFVMVFDTAFSDSTGAKPPKPAYAFSGFTDSGAYELRQITDGGWTMSLGWQGGQLSASVLSPVAADQWSALAAETPYLPLALASQGGGAGTATVTATLRTNVFAVSGTGISFSPGRTNAVDVITGSNCFKVVSGDVTLLESDGGALKIKDTNGTDRTVAFLTDLVTTRRMPDYIDPAHYFVQWERGTGIVYRVQGGVTSPAAYMVTQPNSPTLVNSNRLPDFNDPDHSFVQWENGTGKVYRAQGGVTSLVAYVLQSPTPTPADAVVNRVWDRTNTGHGFVQWEHGTGVVYNVYGGVTSLVTYIVTQASGPELPDTVTEPDTSLRDYQDQDWFVRWETGTGKVYRVVNGSDTQFVSYVVSQQSSPSIPVPDTSRVLDMAKPDYQFAAWENGTGAVYWVSGSTTQLVHYILHGDQPTLTIPGNDTVTDYADPDYFVRWMHGTGIVYRVTGGGVDTNAVGFLLSHTTPDVPPSKYVLDNAEPHTFVRWDYGTGAVYYASGAVTTRVGYVVMQEDSPTITIPTPESNPPTFVLGYDDPSWIVRWEGGQGIVYQIQGVVTQRMGYVLQGQTPTVSVPEASLWRWFLPDSTTEWGEWDGGTNIVYKQVNEQGQTNILYRYVLSTNAVAAISRPTQLFSPDISTNAWGELDPGFTNLVIKSVSGTATSTLYRFWLPTHAQFTNWIWASTNWARSPAATITAGNIASWNLGGQPPRWYSLATSQTWAEWNQAMTNIVIKSSDGGATTNTLRTFMMVTNPATATALAQVAADRYTKAEADARYALTGTAAKPVYWYDVTQTNRWAEWDGGTNIVIKSTAYTGRCWRVSIPAGITNNGVEVQAATNFLSWAPQPLQVAYYSGFGIVNNSGVYTAVSYTPVLASMESDDYSSSILNLTEIKLWCTFTHPGLPEDMRLDWATNWPVTVTEHVYPVKTWLDLIQGSSVFEISAADIDRWNEAAEGILNVSEWYDTTAHYTTNRWAEWSGGTNIVIKEQPVDGGAITTLHTYRLTTNDISQLVNQSQLEEAMARAANTAGAATSWVDASNSNMWWEAWGGTQLVVTARTPYYTTNYGVRFSADFEGTTFTNITTFPFTYVIDAGVEAMGYFEDGLAKISYSNTYTWASASTAFTQTLDLTSATYSNVVTMSADFSLRDENGDLVDNALAGLTLPWPFDQSGYTTWSGGDPASAVIYSPSVGGYSTSWEAQDIDPWSDAHFQATSMALGAAYGSIITTPLGSGTAYVYVASMDLHYTTNHVASYNLALPVQTRQLYDTATSNTWITLDHGSNVVVWQTQSVTGWRMRIPEPLMAGATEVMPATNYWVTDLPAYPEALNGDYDDTRLQFHIGSGGDTDAYYLMDWTVSQAGVEGVSSNWVFATYSGGTGTAYLEWVEMSTTTNELYRLNLAAPSPDTWSAPHAASAMRLTSATPEPSDTTTFMDLRHDTNVITRVVTSGWYLDTTLMTTNGNPFAQANARVQWLGMPDAPLPDIGWGSTDAYYGTGALAMYRFLILEGTPYFICDSDGDGAGLWSGATGQGPAEFIMDSPLGTIGGYAVGGTARFYFVPAATNTVPAHVNLASPIPFGPVIGGVQSLFRTDGTNLWWKNVNNVEVPVVTSNTTVLADGVLNGTNGVFFTRNGTNYWLLLD